MKLTIDNKKEIIKLWKEGYSYKRISLKFNITESIVQKNVEKYQLYGDKIFEVKSSNRKYTPEFKLKILMRIKEGESINSVANEYMLYDGMIHSWIKKYEELGYNGLITQKRGRPKMRKSKESKKVILTEDERKRYEARIKQLEMENELLKKLDALVQERIKQEKEKK